jgi:uncharacterized membrane-anchored protein
MIYGVAGLVSVAFTAAAPLGASPESRPNVTIARGPSRVDLGEVAELMVPSGMAFANGEAARFVLSKRGNPGTGHEVGIVMSTAPDEGWFIVLEYIAGGYVGDADPVINQDAVLARLRANNEQANAERKQKGAKTGQLVGWYEEPHYDSRMHSLRWAVLAREAGSDQWVNYKAIILGRAGIMALTLVEAPEEFRTTKPKIEQVVGGFSFTKGNAYADWRPGDSVAESTLSDFIAPGEARSTSVIGRIGQYLMLSVGERVAEIILSVVSMIVIGAILIVLCFPLRLFKRTRRPTVCVPMIAVPLALVVLVLNLLADATNRLPLWQVIFSWILGGWVAAQFYERQDKRARTAASSPRG